MLILLSPAKTLDFDSKIAEKILYKATIPDFAQETQELVQILKKYTAQDLAKLFDLSPQLAELNFQRFKNFAHEYTVENSRPAIFAYKGDVYEGLELDQYTDEELDFANRTLRIISGLYGILMPLDLIQPYRLEMVINLPNECGKNLYAFWNNVLSNKLNEHCMKYKARHIINLASNEYSTAINAKILDRPMINIVFKEKHQDDYKIIGLHAKKARGVMANFIIRNQLTEPTELKSFVGNNYQFMPHLSTEGEYVFVR